MSKGENCPRDKMFQNLSEKRAELEVRKTKVRKTRRERMKTSQKVGKVKVTATSPPASDQYLYCDYCQQDVLDGCQKHPNFVKTQQLNRLIGVRKSPNGFGVFNVSGQRIKIGKIFGPYTGRFLTLKQSANKKSLSPYTWQVLNGSKIKVVGFVDPGQNPDPSKHVLAFVGSAQSIADQNVVPVQFKSNIYFKVFRPIEPDAEVLTFFGQNYSKSIGLDPTKFLSAEHDETSCVEKSTTCKPRKRKCTSSDEESKTQRSKIQKFLAESDTDDEESNSGQRQTNEKVAVSCAAGTSQSSTVVGNANANHVLTSTVVNDKGGRDSTIITTSDQVATEVNSCNMNKAGNPINIITDENSNNNTNLNSNTDTCLTADSNKGINKTSATTITSKSNNRDANDSTKTHNGVNDVHHTWRADVTNNNQTLVKSSNRVVANGSDSTATANNDKRSHSKGRRDKEENVAPINVKILALNDCDFVKKGNSKADVSNLSDINPLKNRNNALADSFLGNSKDLMKNANNLSADTPVFNDTALTSTFGNGRTTPNDELSVVTLGKNEKKRRDQNNWPTVEPNLSDATILESKKLHDSQEMTFKRTPFVMLRKLSNQTLKQLAATNETLSANIKHQEKLTNIYNHQSPSEKNQTKTPKESHKEEAHSTGKTIRMQTSTRSESSTDEDILTYAETITYNFSSPFRKNQTSTPNKSHKKMAQANEDDIQDATKSSGTVNEVQTEEVLSDADTVIYKPPSPFRKYHTSKPNESYKEMAQVKDNPIQKQASAGAKSITCEEGDTDDETVIYEHASPFRKYYTNQSDESCKRMAQAKDQQTSFTNEEVKAEIDSNVIYTPASLIRKPDTSMPFESHNQTAKASDQIVVPIIFIDDDNELGEAETVTQKPEQTSARKLVAKTAHEELRPQSYRSMILKLNPTNEGGLPTSHSNLRQKKCPRNVIDVKLARNSETVNNGVRSSPVSVALPPRPPRAVVRPLETFTRRSTASSAAKSASSDRFSSHPTTAKENDNDGSTVKGSQSPLQANLNAKPRSIEKGGMMLQSNLVCEDLSCDEEDAKDFSPLTLSEIEKCLESSSDDDIIIL